MTRDHLMTAALWLCVGSVAVMNGVLYTQNRSIKAAKSAAAPAARNPSVGQTIPRLAGIRDDSQFTEVSASGSGRTLIIGFSTACRYSRANYQKWTELSAVAQRAGMTVVWVTPERLSRVTPYLQDYPIKDVVIADTTHDTYRALGLDTVPTTTMVDTGWRVTHVWYGELLPDKWRSLLATVSDTPGNSHKGE